MIPTLPQRAQFNPLIRSYLVLYVAGVLLISVAGILLLPFWLLGVGQWWARHYFDKLECELSDRALRYRKGILVTVEKTIPLENIQDVTLVEGPLLRRFNLAMLKFETAGHAERQANDMKLIGVIAAREFRDQILQTRDSLKAQGRAPDQTEILSAIHGDLREMLTLMRGKG